MKCEKREGKLSVSVQSTICVRSGHEMTSRTSNRVMLVSFNEDEKWNTQRQSKDVQRKKTMSQASLRDNRSEFQDFTSCIIMRQTCGPKVLLVNRGAAIGLWVSSTHIDVSALLLVALLFPSNPFSEFIARSAWAIRITSCMMSPET